MRLGHYQCICPEGDFERSLAVVRHGLDLAADARLDLLSFPECVLTGYFRDAATARRHAFALESPEMERVYALTRAYPGVMTVVSFNERRGDHLHIAAAVIADGRLHGCYRKTFPVFAHETPGDAFPVFENNGLRFGIVICADGTFIEPCRILALKGARLVIAPHHNYVDDPLDHCLHARRNHAARAVENGIYYLRGNNVMPRAEYGAPVNGVPYYGYGDSYLINPHGETVAGAGLHDETLMIYQLDPDRYRPHPTRPSFSRRSAERLLEPLREALAGDRGQWAVGSGR